MPRKKGKWRLDNLRKRGADCPPPDLIEDAVKDKVHPPENIQEVDAPDALNTKQA